VPGGMRPQPFLGWAVTAFAAKAGAQGVRHLVLFVPENVRTVAAQAQWVPLGVSVLQPGQVLEVLLHEPGALVEQDRVGFGVRILADPDAVLAGQTGREAGVILIATRFQAAMAGSPGTGGCTGQSKSIPLTKRSLKGRASRLAVDAPG